MTYNSFGNLDDIEYILNYLQITFSYINRADCYATVCICRNLPLVGDWWEYRITPEYFDDGLLEIISYKFLINKRNKK